MRLALLAVTAAALALSACGSGTDNTTEHTATAAVQTVASTDAEGVVIEHRFGDTAKVSDTGEYGGNATYTVSAPVGDTVTVDVAVVTGNAWVPGTLQGLTETGKRVEAVDGTYDHTGTMMVGERRTGTLRFDTPEKITRVVLYLGTVNPPVAVWT